MSTDNGCFSMTHMTRPASQKTYLAYECRLSLPVHYIHHEYLITAPLGLEAFPQLDPHSSLIQKNNAVQYKIYVNELSNFNKIQQIAA